MFHNKVLAVELSLPAFDPNRVDKGLSAEMADQKSANREMLAVRKRLLPKKQTADIHAHDVDTREWVESNTSPYAAGLRIIDTRNLDHFMGVEEGVKRKRRRGGEDSPSRRLQCGGLPAPREGCGQVQVRA